MIILSLQCENRKKQVYQAKHYGVIFTCLNTGAMHLEPAVDYSTMEYTQLLRRFFAIRGYLHEMLSDIGSQLVGAEKEMQLMIKRLGHTAVERFLCR